MKESKFLELLNLYIDQQIESAEAAKLEEEILRNPARRRVYQQYCRMHRACVSLVEQARPEVNVGEKLAATVAVVEEKVMEFPEPRRGNARAIYLGGLAAACIALAFIVTRTLQRSPTAPALASQPEQVVQITPAPGSPIDPAQGKISFQPVLVTHILRLPTNNPAAAAGSATGNRLSLEWMNQVKFTPVSVLSEDLELDNQSAIKSGQRDAQQRVFHNGLPTQNELPQSAFRFQR